MTEMILRESTDISPAGFGQKATVAAIRDRIVAMMPGAADAPPDVQWAAAQLAVLHKLNPFNGEIYVIRLGKKKVGNQWVDDWRTHVGVKGLRTLARRQANFMTEERELSPEEVKHLRRDNYDPKDVGVEVTLWRLDVARECKELGIPYAPVKATGFWRVKAQYHRQNSEWMPDSVPNTWNEYDVAAKRAEINAIKKGFDMVIDVGDPSIENDVEVLGEQVASMERDEAPIMQRELTYEEDGELLYAGGR